MTAAITSYYDHLPIKLQASKYTPQHYLPLLSTVIDWYFSHQLGLRWWCSVAASCFDLERPTAIYLKLMGVDWDVGGDNQCRMLNY